MFFALANFLITAIIGALLRYNNVNPMADFADRYWIHGHSHVGFLGWIFLALLTFSFGMLLPKNAKTNRRIYRLLVYSQVAVLGMLATFPFMGYAAPSIIFSSVHMILSVLYVMVFFGNAEKPDLASKFMKAALVFMLISYLGPLALGPIIVTGLKGTIWYEMAIYFYLHFQYNGWFTLAIFALFIKLMEQMGLKIAFRKGQFLYYLLVIGAALTVALSALGFGFPSFVDFAGFVGAAIQLWAAYIFLKMLFSSSGFYKVITNIWARAFFAVALFSWIIKITMQFLSVFPVISSFVYHSRDAIMTYLHLSFLGFASSFLIGLLILKKYFSSSNLISKLGFGLFLIGVVSMEVTIGLKSMPQYLSLQLFKSINSALFIESLILLISVTIMIFFSFILPKRPIKRKNPL